MVLRKTVASVARSWRNHNVSMFNIHQQQSYSHLRFRSIATKTSAVTKESEDSLPGSSEPMGTINVPQTVTTSTTQPSLYQKAILKGDYHLAYLEAQKSEQGVAFIANQCVERSFLLYNNTESRQAREVAVAISQKGEHFINSFNGYDTNDMKEGKSNPLLQPQMWAPICQQEWVKLDSTVKLARASLYMKTQSQTKSKDDMDYDLSKEYQIIGKSIVDRLLLGRIASVLQCFMSMRMINYFHPRVFDVHVKAAKNFEDYLKPPGPLGPLDGIDSVSNPDSDSESYSESSDKIYSNDLFYQWKTEREESVCKQMKLISQVIAEVCINVVPRNEALMLLDASREIYKVECDDVKTLNECLKIFDRTEDMI